jgi:hypothetical protein
MRRLLLALPLCLAAAAVHAGTKLSVPVTIDFPIQSAWGALGTARNAASPYERIGCHTGANATGSWGYCFAYDARKNSKTCSFTDPHLVDAARSISGDSYVSFSWEGEQCTGIYVGNDSQYEPKQP